MFLRRLRGLRVQLLLWTILPLAAVLVVLSLAGITRHRQAMTQLVEDRNRGLALAEANRLAREIDGRATLLARRVAQPGALTDLNGLAADMAETYAGGLAMLDSSGQIVAVSDGSEAWPQSEEARTLAARTSTVGQPQFEDHFDASGPHLLIGVPLSGGRALIGAFPAETLSLADSSQQVETEANGAVFVFDANGRLVHHNNPSGLAVDTTALADLALSSGSGGGAADLRGHGQDLLVAHAAVEPPGWTLVIAEDVHAVDTVGMNVVEVLPLVLLFVAVVALLAVYFGVASVVRPLQELDRRAQRVAWGDFEAVKKPVGGVQEMDDLRATLAQMAERIRSYQAGMRDYLSAITLAQEAERARLAHELHDDTVQALIALKQRAQMARKSLGSVSALRQAQETVLPSAQAATTGQGGDDAGRQPRGAAPSVTQDETAGQISDGTNAQGRSVGSGPAPDLLRAGQRLDELTGLIDQELAALRRLIGDLRPIYLEDLGFVPALEMLAQQMEERYGLAVWLSVRGHAVRLASDLELAAFRIVQAALSNVAAHAAASRVDVAVDFAADGVTLIVHDDGRGFTPPDQPADLARNGHFGLMGMRERAMLYGGRLTITSAPGQGTSIEAWLPIH